MSKCWHTQKLLRKPCPGNRPMVEKSLADQSNRLCGWPSGNEHCVYSRLLKTDTLLLTGTFFVSFKAMRLLCPDKLEPSRMSCLDCLKHVMWKHRPGNSSCPLSSIDNSQVEEALIMFDTMCCLGENFKDSMDAISPYPSNVVCRNLVCNCLLGRLLYSTCQFWLAAFGLPGSHQPLQFRVQNWPSLIRLQIFKLLVLICKKS